MLTQRLSKQNGEQHMLLTAVAVSQLAYLAVRLAFQTGRSEWEQKTWWARASWLAW